MPEDHREQAGRKLNFGVLMGDLPPGMVPAKDRLLIALEAIHYFTNNDGMVYVGGGVTVTRRDAITMALEQIHYESAGKGEWRGQNRTRKTPKGAMT